MRVPMLSVAVLATILMTGSHGAQAANTLPFVSRLYSNDMVLQRDHVVPVWGWTAPGSKVSVEIGGRTFSTKASPSGSWETDLPRMHAGGPYTLTVKGISTRTFTNVMVGDVWLCSGQSNMQFGVGNLLHPNKVEAAADYPNLRLYNVLMDISPTPLKTLSANRAYYHANEWLTCTPTNIKQGSWNGFSAVAYYFGRDLDRSLKIPIGLIHSSWGGTIAEAWTSAHALETMPDFTAAAERMANFPASMRPGDPNQVTVLYNAMIAPLEKFPIKGVIWYQGESNVGRAQQYRTLLPTMIQDWRTRWNEGNFPFYIVQIAPWQAVKPQPSQSAWAELQEAQAITARTVPNSGLATCIDIGDPTNIHPKDKSDVGKRLCLLALKHTYHKNVVDSGPTYKSMKIMGNKAIITFAHANGGLKVMDTTLAHGDTIQGFAIAGADRKWVWANAKIVGNKVVLGSPDVAHPLAVRYAWADAPICNLFNGADLPAPPFRTDHWK